MSDYAFCPACGARLTPPDDRRWTACPHCRSLIRRSWKELDTGFYRLDIMRRPPLPHGKPVQEA